MKLSLIKYILNGFPEVLLLLYVTLALLNVKISFRNYIKIGIINEFFLWLIRDCLNLFGLHTFIGLIIIISSINYLVKIDIRKIIISVLISFIILFIGETSVFSIMVNLFDLDIEELNYSLKLYFIGAYASKIPLIIAAVAINRLNIKIFNK